MKIFTTTVIALALSTLVGCVSSYTSIEETVNENEYIVTEINQHPFGFASKVHACKAKSNTELECRTLN
jgi:hypothetical protein